jgi:hypothetical protein
VRRLHRTPRRRILAALGAIAAVAVAVAIILGSGLTGSTKAAGPSAKAHGSTTVQRRDLIATDTESGTLSYADPQTVFNRLSGTVTWLPPIGRVIKPGQTLYKVDGARVVLFNGTLPAYRDLSEADTDGPDIEQLKRDLRALGFDPQHQMTLDQTFDAATAAAVERWQESVGEPQTGSITLGQIVFLPGSQRVTTVDAQLGSTGGSSAASAAGSSPNTSTVVSSHPEFVSLSTKPAKPTKPTTSTPSCKPSKAKPTGSQSSAQQPTTQCKQSQPSSSASSKQQLAALLALLKAETLELQKAKSGSGTGGGRSGGGSSTAAAGRSGGGGGGAAGGGTASAAAAESASGGSDGSSGAGANAQPILQTTSTQLVVTVDLDATMQSEAVVHEPVTVELPSGSTVGGKITQVSPVAQTSSSSSSSSSSSASSGGGGGSNAPTATVPVTIALTGHRHVAGLDQAAVSVNFEQQKATNVLSVPVTALLATAGGGYAVQEAQQPSKLLPVTPGLFAAGYVQISGPGIFPGLQVTDSQG